MSASDRPDERPLANPRPFLVLAVLGATAIVVLVVIMLRPPGLPTLVAEDYMRVAGGLIVPQPSSSPTELEAAASPPGVILPVPDLDAEGYVLAGGRAHQLDGRFGLLAVYRNRLQDLLVYQVWPGSADSLPSTRDVREMEDRRFFVHQKATTTVVFWQQDGLLRVVASSLPTEQVVRLAVAAAQA